MSTIDLHTFNELKDSTGADFIGELIAAFLDDAPDLFSQMRTALAKQDSDSFRRAAHSMKSNAATFGAMELSSLAKELESMARDNNLDIRSRLEHLEAAFQRAATELKRLK